MPQSRGLEGPRVNIDSVNRRAVVVSRVMVSIRSQFGLRCELLGRSKPLRDHRQADVAFAIRDELDRARLGWFGLFGEREGVASRPLAQP
jgi:hypothetical protein